MKRAFFVTGPESSGTRLMTSILIAAGCYGDDTHDQRLDHAIPDDEYLLAWRRSVPHRGEWVNASYYLEKLQAAGYETMTIIMSRDWHSMAISQEQAPHAVNVNIAQENIQQAYRHIFQYLTGRFEIINYESLTQRPMGTIHYLLCRLGLPEPGAFPAVYDGNLKYYTNV